MSSKLGFVSRRSSGTLPVVRTKEPPKKKGVSPISSPKLVEKWEYRALDNDGQLTNGETNAVATEAGEETSHQIPLFYHKVNFDWIYFCVQFSEIKKLFACGFLLNSIISQSWVHCSCIYT